MLPFLIIIVLFISISSFFQKHKTEYREAKITLSKEEIYNFLSGYYPHHLTQREISKMLGIPFREVIAFTQAMNYYYHACKSNTPSFQNFISDADVVENIFKK